MKAEPATEAELVELLDRAPPWLLRRAIAHAAGLLADAEGSQVAVRVTGNVAGALRQIQPSLNS